MASLIEARHIQNLSDAKYIQHHWGYSNRAMPCTKDEGTCEYLSAVYWMHDTSMLYTFILWAVIGGLLIIFVTLRVLRPKAETSTKYDSESQNAETAGPLLRGWRAIASSSRRYLLPETRIRFFGHVTRLQALTLSIILAYLLVFSMVGITYRTWHTPVTGMNLTNTRTGFGGFGDRVGALAYALTPLSVLLSSRESILSILTGIPYQSFNFIHRWLGRIMVVQAIIHTFAWTLVEGKFYKPQPTTYQEFISEPYIIWGCVALALLMFLYIFSISSVIKLTGYEFFRKSHFIIAGVYIGACWAHWDRLACWMIASLGIMLLDRGIRLLRVVLIHTGAIDGKTGFGFYPAQASMKYFDDKHGGVVRLDYTHKTSWKAGQHFFLCFPALSIWQSHPLTVGSLPTSTASKQTYIIRCRNGETRKLGDLAKASEVDSTTPVILTGPYGETMLSPESENVLLVAGGTGITLTLPLAFEVMKSQCHKSVEMIWSVRHENDIQWMGPELEELKSTAAGSNSRLKIHIFVTREGRGTSEEFTEGEKNVESEDKEVNSFSMDSTEESFTITRLANRHPDMKSIVTTYVDGRHARTTVIGSGPAGMGQDLRAAVAACNDGGKVWKGDGSHDVDLKWDNRG